MMLAVACQPQGGKTDKTEKPAAADKDAKGKDKDAKPAEDVPEGPCGDYAAKLCEVVGEKTPSCNNAKSITELMPEAACKAGLADIPYSKSKFESKREICTTRGRSVGIL